MSSHRRDIAISEIAARQEGLIRRDQLATLGFVSSAIDRRVRRGFLHRIHRGVYAVGHANLSDAAAYLAEVYAAGEGAAASGASAAHLWRMIAWLPAQIEVSIPEGRRPRRGVHSRSVILPAGEITTVGVIPVTIPARTILDCAGNGFRKRQVEKLINEAEYLELPMPLSLPILLDRYPRRPGTPMIREILAERGGLEVTKSELEELFRAFVAERTLVRPLWNQPFDLSGERIYPDCIWPAQRLMAELDGGKAHGTRSRLISDKRRDRRLTALGWRVVRITWYDLVHRPDELEVDLRSLLGA